MLSEGEPMKELLSTLRSLHLSARAAPRRPRFDARPTHARVRARTREPARELDVAFELRPDPLTGGPPGVADCIDPFLLTGS